MSQVKTQKAADGGFLLSEAPGHRSREECTIVSGQVLEAGTVLGRITSGGKFKAADNDASDGSQTAVGILIHAVDTSSTGFNADRLASYIARDAEVNGNELKYGSTEDGGDQTANLADLAALGISVRTLT